MADVGFGTGTPVVTPPPLPSDVVAYAAPSLPITLLSLSQFAQILGLDPLHFASGYSSLRPSGDCHDIWMQYQWQESGKASRAEVTRVIHAAEEDIAFLTGYWPAWTWIDDERHQLQRGGLWPHLERLRLSTKWRHVISGGAKTTTAIEATSVARGADIDADGDGFAELAQFTLTGITATWELEEIRACFKEYAVLDADNCRLDPVSTDFDENWEVRPLQLKRTGTTVVAYVPVWLLFKPQLQMAHNAEHIDADDADSYVDTISFYRVYSDISSQVQFMWGTDCVDDVSCAWATQAGCIRTLDQRAGTVTVVPGSYDEDCDCYTAGSWLRGTSPDAARLWYRAGLARPAPGIMDHTMARLVTMLACARLDYPVCTCGNAQTLVAEWRENAAKATRERTYTFTADMISNPLGMRVGEVLVYQSLKVPARRVGQAVRA
jgi:hypothetical protein